MLSLIFCTLSLLSRSVESVLSKPHWVIVLDCGSTKTAAFFYQFKVNKDTKTLELHESISHRWKKALSQFNPTSDSDKKEMEEGFDVIFQKADQNINATERATTPVFVYATAGLRALPKVRAEALLQLARAAIVKSHYDKHIADVGLERVTMITGSAEGLYAWLAVNYILSAHKMKEQQADDDYGILDLGGGSTQIAFRPDSFELLADVGRTPGSLIHPMRKTPKPSLGPGVFSKSFLDYGNNVNIMKMVGAFDDCKATSGCPANKIYRSPCLHPKFKGTFVHGTSKFKIEGMYLDDPSQRFCICKNHAMRVLRRYGDIPEYFIGDTRVLLGNNLTTYVGLSAYYYATNYIKDHQNVAKAGSICKGYKMTVAEFHEGAWRVCQYPENANNPYTPYACMLNSYASTLIDFGYHLPSTTTLYMCNGLYVKYGNETKKVRANWALGVALQSTIRILEPDLQTINNILY